MSLHVKRFQGAPATPRYCESCSSEHIGQVPCGMTWLQRLKSATFDQLTTHPSKTTNKYWDQESITETFGEDARDDFMEVTQGKGVDGDLTGLFE